MEATKKEVLREGTYAIPNGYEAKVSSDGCVIIEKKPEEYTEFEKHVKNIIRTTYNYDDACPENQPYLPVDAPQNIHAIAKSLLEAARNELGLPTELERINKEFRKTFNYYEYGYRDGINAAENFLRENLWLLDDTAEGRQRFVTDMVHAIENRKTEI